LRDRGSVSTFSIQEFGGIVRRFGKVRLKFQSLLKCGKRTVIIVFGFKDYTERIPRDG
jgi:hypothetical protein